MTVDAKLEAILMVADEPISLVSLATAVDEPMPAVREALERLQADYNGEAEGSPERPGQGQPALVGKDLPLRLRGDDAGGAGRRGRRISVVR